eukprot:COSAG01_NODE_4416_length_5047_cov_4.569523_1_plen_80_part_00
MQAAAAPRAAIGVSQQAAAAAPHCGRTSRSKLCTNRAFLFFRTQPAAGRPYPQFAYYRLCMLLRRCACWRRPLGFPYRT